MVFLRTLLIWMMVLAVPAQGVSAATMALCGPGHHSALESSDGHEASRMVQDHEDEVDSASVTHEHVSMAVAEPSTDMTAAGMVPAHTKHKCSACASCCVAAAALPAALSVLPTPVLANSLVALVPRSDSSVSVDGLERPPRSLLV